MVAHLLWEQGVAGSSPVTPTKMAWWANGKAAPVVMGEVCNKTVFNNEEQQCRELPKVEYQNKHRSGGIRDAKG